ncbi:MAG: class II fructose-bisphosphate aldolase [Chloroflexota bacterium]
MSVELDELINLVENSMNYSHGKVIVTDPQVLQEKIHRWVEVSTLETGIRQGWVRFLVRRVAQELGIHPASIHDLYMARGRDEISHTFTVPAINLRVLSFDAARAAFRAAISMNAASIIFEIARSEIGYTSQRPAEFSTNILAAAIAENYKGPVFIQGDHFQISAKRYAVDPDAELNSIKALILEAINAGFYNIDIDTSTLVDISISDITEQQKLNVELSAYFSNFIREHQPEGVIISIGGEIGEVGGRNSTVEELRAYLNGFNEAINIQRPGSIGLSKISIQTGTSHGGIVLPDGSIAKVKVDFDTLCDLSRSSRAEYGLGGTVQHGASTLPEDAFGKFVESEAIEVHLATNFMNMFFEYAPDHLRKKMYAYLDKNFASDRKADMTDEQFYYKTRKNAIGPFKEEIIKLPKEFHEKMRSAWEEKFVVLFKLLGLEGTRHFVDRYIHPVVKLSRLEDFLGSEYKKEDVGDLAD